MDLPYDTIYQTGAHWRHNRLQVEVVLHAHGEGQFTVVPASKATVPGGPVTLPDAHDYWLFYGTFSTNELNTQFTPLLKAGRYDVLLNELDLED